MPMVMSMRENGRMIKLMVKESIHMLMAVDTMVIGLKISNMVLDLKNGLMVLPIKESMSKAKNTEKENSHGLMVVPLLESSWTTISMVSVSMNGLTGESSMVNGRITRWRDMVPLPGLMVVNTLDSTLTT